MKITGIILILTASFAMVYMTVKREMLRCKHIEQIIESFEIIKLRTVHYSDSLSSIINEIQFDSDIFNQFILLCNKGTEPDTAWTQAVNSSKMILSFSEKEMIKNSFNDICSSSIETLEEKCNKYINEFTNIKNQHIENKENKIKISSLAIITASLLIIIILV